MADKMLAVLMAACWSVAACSMDQGTGQLGPELWTAWVECPSGDRMMQVGEVEHLEADWSCKPAAPDDKVGKVRCWRGDSEVTLGFACTPQTRRSTMLLGDSCQVHLSCDGQGLFYVD
jgi:hypothetical protein